MSNLFDIAPRLARAQAERRWEIVPEGGEGKPGTQWATLTNVRHTTGRCRQCGGRRDIMHAIQRIEVGVNQKTVMPLATAECRDCGTSESSNYRRFV